MSRDKIEKEISSCEIIYMAKKHFDGEATDLMIKELVDKIYVLCMISETETKCNAT